MGAHQTTGVDRQLIRGEDPTDTSVSTSVSSDDTSDLSKTATVSLTLVDAPVSGFVNQLHRLSRFVTNAARKLKPGTSPKPVDSSRLSGGQKSTDDHNETFDRCRRLRVLFWKDFVICKWRRHYIKSTLELILPVGILLLVAWSRGYGEQIGGTWEGPDKYPEVNLSALVTLKETGSEIVYSPATNYTDTIVPDAFRNPNSRPVFTGFHTVDMMMQYLESNYSTDVSLAIVFDPETAQHLRPGVLDYTLRFNATRYEFHISKSFWLSSEPRTKNIAPEEHSILWPSINALFVTHLKFYGLQSKHSDLSFIPTVKYFPTPKYFAPSGGFVATEIVAGTISLVCVLPLLLFAVQIIRDKESRIKELLRMMGLSNFIYWTNLFLVGFTTVAILMVIAWVLFCFPVFGAHMYSASDPSLILTIFMLFAAAEVLQTLLVTVILNSTTLGGIAVLGVFYLSSFSAQQFDKQENDYSEATLATKLGLSLLPLNGLYVISKIITYREFSNVGVQWSNIAGIAQPGDNVSLLAILLTMLLSCLIYAFLIFYFDAVLPWQPGIPKHPLFLCQSCRSPDPTGDSLSSTASLTSRHHQRNAPSKMIEKAPSCVTSPIIQMRHVTHWFGPKKVLDDLSLELYRNQITIFLGHNGAGKTTAMGILAGLLPPTSGKVYINGFNVQKSTAKARQGVGLCPQHNVLFDELTVKEHLEFFAGVKGAEVDVAKREMEKLISQFELTSHRDSLAGNLSGGMKRRLCTANALVGGSNIVILDEPTAGMDPEIRRRIWTILQEARRHRTILMSTHDMEEADVLGDRIAILAKGKLKCAGSPIFLKKAFETGYNLRCVKSGPKIYMQETLLRVQQCLGENQVRLVSEIGLQFCLNLGFPSTADFIKLFRDLEARKEQLGIASWGVSVTTMEDVFLKVGQPDDDVKCLPELQQQPVLLFTRYTRSTGSRLWRGQFGALYLKRGRVVRRQWFMPIVLLVVPCSLVAFFGLNTRSYFAAGLAPEASALHYSFKSLSQGRRSEGFVRKTGAGTTSGISALKLAMEQDNVNVRELDNDVDIDDFLLETATTSPFAYKSLWRMGGASNHSKHEDIVLWLNAEPYHVAAAAIIRWQTASLSQLLQRTKNATVAVNVRNHPFSTGTLKQGGASFEIHLRVMAFFLIQLALSFVTCAAILFPIEERVSKAQLLQRMTGVHSVVYHGASFTFDFLTVLLCSGIIAIVLAICDPADSAGEEIEVGVATCLLLATYGAMMILVSFVFSSMFNSPGNGFTVLLIITALVGGIIAPILILVMISCTVPDSTMEFCYKRETLFQMDFRLGIGLQMMVISIGIAVVLTLLVARESDLIRLCLIPFKWLRSAIYRRFSSNTTTAVATCEDSDVGAERRRAEDALKRGHHHRHALVTRDLTKVYDGFTAVDHISFAVDKKECFGLLGVNGAGKSTMFNMLTGDLPMSDGNAYIFDSNLRSSLRRYQTYVGFCPQVDALLDKLTGRETLELLCALRGVPADKQAPVITQMVSLVDLGPDADNLTSTYSGGTKRKLSLGLAVIGNLPVILLDEPTAGVDPAGRRKIWSTITQAQRNGSAIVFTSHSMAECETLCGRMVIMVNGTFRCLGSSQHLKTKFSQGFSVTIKLKPSDHQSVVVSNLLASMERYFPGKNALKDSHQCILHFHITDTELRWSELFEIVQQLQAEFHFEDVVVSDASLEQIFLAFAAKRVAMIPSA